MAEQSLSLYPSFAAGEEAEVSAVIGHPAWLPKHIPAFDGLRGIAILAVLFYHCHTKMAGTFLEKFAQWGWAGVDLFFVLSGFLITGIILETRQEPRFYQNFYARRILRIWPAYILLLVLNYIFFPWLFSGFRWMFQQLCLAPWLYYALFIQNLFWITVPGTIGPTWSLAIEQQFYLFWAPVARRFGLRPLLAGLLVILCASPIIRYVTIGHVTQTNTLAHLDGLAVGSIIAVAVRLFTWTITVWRWISRTALATGVCAIALMLHHGSSLSNTLLAIGFGGMLLAAVLPAERSFYQRTLNWRPLVHVGTISYGLYVMHILVFSVLGGYVDRYLDSRGIAGGLAIVAIRFAASIGFASLLWVRFEKPILKLKRHFTSRTLSPAPVIEAAPSVEAAPAS